MIDKNKYSVYGLGDVSTVILIRELDLRLSDWNRDPDPQYDGCFAYLSKGQTKMLEYSVQAVLEKYAKATIERVIKDDPDLLEAYGDYLS